MSLDGLRDAYSREKKNEIQNCELSRKRKLRELYNYTTLLNSTGPPKPQDFIISEDPGESERRFLDENDITKGRRFNDSTLPYPFQNAYSPATLPFNAPSKGGKSALSSAKQSPVVGASISLEEQLRAASASPSVATQPLPSIEKPTPQEPASLSQPPAHSPRLDSTTQHELSTASRVAEEEEANSVSAEAQQVQRAHPVETSEADIMEDLQKSTPSEPVVNPTVAIPPSQDDVAVPPETAGMNESVKAPQVVHLPPKAVQEAKLKETEKRLEKAREKERKEDEKLALPHANGPTDFVSSPSSTVGPYSQATPHAPHHSPDTSPDTEAFREQPPSIGNEASQDIASQKAKEDNERALQEQMREARQRARAVSSETPEVERQIEDEQAIRLARDGKSQQSESQPPPGPQALVEHASDVVQEIKSDHGDLDDKTIHNVEADSLPTPTTVAPEPPSTLDPEKAESLPPITQEPLTTGPDHPTPPADEDIEMNDAPAQAKDQSQQNPQPPSTPSTRLTTGVSSGIIRQRSVSEVMGEKTTPKPPLTPLTSDLTQIESPTRPNSRDPKAQEVPTVIFAKKDAMRPSKALQLYNEDYASLQGASQDSNRDYLQGLFQFQAHHPPRSQPLSELVSSARKTLSTAGTLAMTRESQDYKILKRVYQLQNANRWSLRQLQKSTEPARPQTHIDHMLKEMKWMHTDFKEERKWKKALAATFADWCAEYISSSPEERMQLRVRARLPNHATHSNAVDDEMNDATTPDLVHYGANETESDSLADDEELMSPFGSKPPAGLFTLGFNEVVMKINHTPASEVMLRELPMYDPLLEGASDVTPVSFCDPPILPVSKFVTGKLVSKVRGPPKKRSRFDYDSEEEPSTPPSRSGTSAEHSMPSTPGRRLFHRNDLSPEMMDVALFNPENKHVRDRLQAAHQFRPPTEFLMPPVSFFESRNSSQWLWEEDQRLRSLVKEYTFNWSLVAQELSLSSKFVSASGRRTPWECFERWVQLEGLPAEMSKTPYFRTYQNRLEQAQRTVTAQHQAQQQMLQQQAQQGQSIPGQMRRRTTQPIRVERRRDNRHLSIIDGMRKLARKRESAAHKSSEAAKAAALRKAHEPAPPKSNAQTPQEWSRMKWEREEKLKQKMQMQHEMQLRVSAPIYLQPTVLTPTQQQQVLAAAQRQAPGMVNGVNPQQRTGTPGNNAAIPTPMANGPSQPGHMNQSGNMAAQQMPRQQAMPGNFPNGNMGSMAMNSSGVPQAQMQATMQNAQRMPPPDQMRLAMQRGQFPTNQQQFQLQQQQINMASNLTAGMGMGNGMPNANMIANMAGQNMNGNMNVSMNGMNGMNGMPNNAGSPRMNQVQMQTPARPLSSGHMPQLLQIQNNLKNQHPELTPEQNQKMASEQLNRFLAKQRAQAMNAATGATSGMNSSPQLGNNMYLQNNGMQNSPSPNAVQNYQNQLLQQQRMMSQQQRQAGSPGMNTVRPVSRSATPQNPQLGMQSPGTQQSQMARNQ